MVVVVEEGGAAVAVLAGYGGRRRKHLLGYWLKDVPLVAMEEPTSPSASTPRFK